MADKYILRGKLPVQEKNLLRWGEWMEHGDRIVKQDRIGGVLVSTVFLGLDHDFSGLGPPVLFETMVFHGASADSMRRYSTWEEAEEGHAEILKETLQQQ